MKNDAGGGGGDDNAHVREIFIVAFCDLKMQMLSGQLAESLKS